MFWRNRQQTEMAVALAERLAVAQRDIAELRDAVFALDHEIAIAHRDISNLRARVERPRVAMIDHRMMPKDNVSTPAN